MGVLESMLIGYIDVRQKGEGSCVYASINTYIRDTCQCTQQLLVHTAYSGQTADLSKLVNLHSNKLILQTLTFCLNVPKSRKRISFPFVNTSSCTVVVNADNTASISFLVSSVFSFNISRSSDFPSTCYKSFGKQTNKSTTKCMA